MHSHDEVGPAGDTEGKVRVVGVPRHPLTPGLIVHFMQSPQLRPEHSLEVLLIADLRTTEDCDERCEAVVQVDP